MRVGAHTIRRTQLPQLGPVALSLLPLESPDTGSALLATLRPILPVIEDLGSILYQRTVRPDLIEESLLVRAIPAQLLRDRLNALRADLPQPAPLPALIRPGTVVDTMKLSAWAPVTLRYVTADRAAVVELAGRLMRVERRALLLLPFSSADNDRRLIVRAVQSGAVLATPEDDPAQTLQLLPDALMPDSLPPRLLGDLPLDAWLMLADPPDADNVRTIVLEQPLFLWGLSLSPGSLIRVGTDGRLLGLRFIAAQIVGDRHLPPGTRLDSVPPCDLEERRLDGQVFCLNVDGERLVERR
jgi:hypothetical protein